MTQAEHAAAPPPGQVEWLSTAPAIRRVIAPNPSPMTFWGTNSYILGRGEVAVIDPGPEDPAHLAALQAALAPGERISHIFVTHPHLDHSPGARPLARATGAQVHAFGPARAGQSPVMRALMEQGLAAGGEGVDHGFAPDVRLADGAVVEANSWHLTALHTPGHMASHMSFAMEGHVFTGDHVMGWASSLISPPDGDLTRFMASCRALMARNDVAYYPGHGAPVADPAARLAWLVEHRLAREAAILAALAQAGGADVADLTARVYTDTPRALLAMAQRNVFAHLIDLVGRGKVVARPRLALNARFSLV